MYWWRDLNPQPWMYKIPALTYCATSVLYIKTNFIIFMCQWQDSNLLTAKANTNYLLTRDCFTDRCRYTGDFNFFSYAIIKESNLTAGIQAGMLPLHQIINDICNLSLFINSQHLLYLSMLQQKVFNAYWISLVRGDRGTRTHNHWLNRPPL